MDLYYEVISEGRIIVLVCGGARSPELDICCTSFG